MIFKEKSCYYFKYGFFNYTGSFPRVSMFFNKHPHGLIYVQTPQIFKSTIVFLAKQMLI